MFKKKKKISGQYSKKLKLFCSDRAGLASRFQQNKYCEWIKPFGGKIKPLAGGLQGVVAENCAASSRGSRAMGISMATCKVS